MSQRPIADGCSLTLSLVKPDLLGAFYRDSWKQSDKELFDDTVYISLTVLISWITLLEAEILGTHIGPGGHPTVPKAMDEDLDMNDMGAMDDMEDMGEMEAMD